MVNWFRKTFFKSKIICVYIFDETGRFNEYVVFPDKTNNVVNIDDCSYIFSAKDVVYVNGYPSVFYMKNNPKPIDFIQKRKIPEITAQEFNSVLNNSIVRDLLKAGKEDKKEQVLFYGIIVCVIGILLLAFFTNNLTNIIQEQQLIIESMNTKLIELNYKLLR